MDVTVSMVTAARGPHRPRVVVATPASSSGLRRNTMNMYTNTTNFSVPVHTHTPNTSAVGIKRRISRIGTAIAHIPFPDSAPTPARHISDEWSRPSLDVRMGHRASETTITSTRGDEAATPSAVPLKKALSFLDRTRPSGKRVDAPWCSLISAEEGLYLDVVILDGVSITRSRLAEVYGFHLGLEERYLAYVRAVDRMVCLRMNDNLGEYVAQALSESREVLDTISAFVTALSPCETESSPIVASLRLASTLHQWTRVAHLTSRPTGPLPPLVFDVRDKLDEVAKIMRDPDEVQRRISLPRL